MGTDMVIASEPFLRQMEKWVQAVREGDFTSAKHHAEFLRKAGELMVMHPEFRQCFTSHTGGHDPQAALGHVCQFLTCATLGRAKSSKAA